MSKRATTVVQSDVIIAATANGSLQHPSARTATKSSSDAWINAIKLAGCAAGGLVFGFAAEKGNVYIPVIIQDQMLFKQFTMLKAFLSAVIAGMGSFVILHHFSPSRKLFQDVRDNYGSCVYNKKLVFIALGCVILGMGMTLSGACPGMTLIQLGSGTQNSLITLAGCFSGALLYGAISPTLNGMLFHKEPRSSESVWMDKLLGVSYTKMAIVLAIAMGGITLLTEYAVPWVPVSSGSRGILEQQNWSPIIAGLLMGLTQLAPILSASDSLGGSSSYCTLLAQTPKVKRTLPYFSKFSSGIGNWWQVAYWIGAASGAALSAYLSGTWGTAAGVSPWFSFLGGAAMLFGARMASGCTSGHGLSGTGLLATSSFVAVPAMFAGGIGLAFAMKAFS